MTLGFWLLNLIVRNLIIVYKWYVISLDDYQLLIAVALRLLSPVTGLAAFFGSVPATGGIEKNAKHIFSKKQKQRRSGYAARRLGRQSSKFKKVTNSEKRYRRKIKPYCN